jgi:hypothetical protein
MATKAQLEAEVKSLRRKAAEFDLYKAKVRDKAIEVANEQEWCRDGLNEALEDLGLTKVPTYMRRTAVISVTYTYDPTSDEDAGGEISHLVIGANRFTDYEIEAWDANHEEPEEVFE